MAMRCLYHLARVSGHPSIHGNTPARLRYRMWIALQHCAYSNRTSAIDKAIHHNVLQNPAPSQES
jgi:hypothetical protein